MKQAGARDFSFVARGAGPYMVEVSEHISAEVPRPGGRARAQAVLRE